jgi:hypothetical protein
MMNQHVLLDTTQRINSQNRCSLIYSQKKTEIYLMAILIAKVSPGLVSAQHRAKAKIMS